MAVDYEKLLRFMLSYFSASEGTDYLDGKGNVENHSALTSEENAELTRIRDEVRKQDGWAGY